MMRFFQYLIFVAFVFTAAGLGLAQSTNQDSPTPAYTSEISGQITARDIGDARLTSHFYTFEGGQGDLFINAVTRNFNGDIDVFTAVGLRPVAKIVIYADQAENETGRVIYLRKPEKLILRVQGRTPGDEPAAYRIKFAGSFVASREIDKGVGDPRVASSQTGGVKVNSVGTIIEQPTEEKNLEKARDEKIERAARTEESATAEPPGRKEKAKPKAPAADPAAELSKTAATSRNKTPKPPKASKTESVPKKASAANERPAKKTTEKPSERAEKPARPTPKKEERSDVEQALENVNLVIEFKDGKVIRRPINDVFRFSVDKGILTVISKDGKIGRYSMLDVAKVTIE